MLLGENQNLRLPCLWGPEQTALTSTSATCLVLQAAFCTWAHNWGGKLRPEFSLCPTHTVLSLVQVYVLQGRSLFLICTKSPSDLTVSHSLLHPHLLDLENTIIFITHYNFQRLFYLVLLLHKVILLPQFYMVNQGFVKPNGGRRFSTEGSRVDTRSQMLCHLGWFSLCTPPVSGEWCLAGLLI